MKSGKISVQQICGALALIWLSQPSVVLAQTIKVSPQLVATGIVPAQKASPLQNQDRDIRKPFKIAQTVTDDSGATTPAKQRPEALVKKGPPNSEKKGLDPVDLASGVFIDSHTDAVVTGGRTPFGFVRSYRSLDKSLGAFGVGTSHNFDIAIQPQSPTVLQLQMNDNARFNFTLNTAGTAYINQSDPTLIGSTIIKNSLGYTLRYKNGETLTFNIRGWLTATTDRNGNRIQILRDNADAMYRIRSTSGFLAFGTTPIQSGSQLDRQHQ